jgi:hypothetical protein
MKRERERERGCGEGRGREREWCRYGLVSPMGQTITELQN